MILRPPRSTRTDTLFPYTTLFRDPLSDPPLVGRYHDDQRRAAHIARDQRNLAAARNAPGGKARGDDQRKDDARGTRVRRRARFDPRRIDRLQPQRQWPDPAARFGDARPDADQPLPPAALAGPDEPRIDEHPLQRPRSRQTPGQRGRRPARDPRREDRADRKSTRLNSSH